jgi:hypothetical protein
VARKLQPKYCACGCGGISKDKWLPGHDRALRAAIENEVGGLVELRRIIEERLHRRINLNHEQHSRRHLQQQ